MRKRTSEEIRRAVALKDADASFLTYTAGGYHANLSDYGRLDNSKVVTIRERGMSVTYAIAVQTLVGAQVSDDEAEQIAVDLAYELELISDPFEKLIVEVL